MRRPILLLLCALLCGSVRPAMGQEELKSRVDRLVGRLASESWAEREDAYREIESLGRSAVPHLRPHQEAEDPEVARLVGRLLREIEAREGDELYDELSARDDAFVKTELFRRIVARGRSLLPDLYRVLDLEDSTYPNYDYWRMKNAYAVIAELAELSDLPTLLARLDHPNPQQRYLLAPILKAMDRDIVLANLVALMIDGEASALARAHAVEMSRDSGLSGSDDRIPKVVRILLDDPEAPVRAAAINWFASRRDDDVTARLTEATRDEAPEVRLAAVRALRNYKGETVREALEAALGDPEGEVRAGALEAIRHTAGPGLAPRLRPFLRDPDPLVRSSAAQTLAQMGDKAALPTLVELLDERSEEFLMRALHSVVTAVGRLGDEAAIPPLLKLMEDSREHPRIKAYRYLILSAILDLGGDDIFPKVEGWIRGGEVQNRHVVLDALARLSRPEVSGILLGAIRQGEGPERNSAVRALLARGQRDAAPAILEALEEEKDPWFLSEAVKALLAFDHRPAVPRMRALLDLDASDGRNVSLFYSLIRAMVRFRVVESAPRISEITQESTNYRYRGIEALGILGDRSVIPALETLLEAEANSSTRYRIALALAMLGRREPLTARIEDPAFPSDPISRAEALVALGRDEEARKLLREARDTYRQEGRGLWNVGCIHVRLGDLDLAFDILGKALDLRPMNRNQLEADVDLDPLRDDPRFEGLLKKVR